MDFTTLGKYLATGCLNIFCHIFSLFPSWISSYCILNFSLFLLGSFGILSTLGEVSLSWYFLNPIFQQTNPLFNSISLVLYSSIEFFISVIIFSFYNFTFYNFISLQIFFSFIFISWRLISLQYCSGFCHTLTWFSYGFTCIPHPDPPSHLPLYPIPLESSQCTRPEHLSHASNLGWWSVSL